MKTITMEPERAKWLANVLTSRIRKKQKKIEIMRRKGYALAIERDELDISACRQIIQDLTA